MAPALGRRRAAAHARARSGEREAACFECHDVGVGGERRTHARKAVAA